MNVRHDFGIVPSHNRAELERRIALATDGDQETTVVLLMNRETFEEQFSQEGVRVMVSDLVPKGNAFVVELARIREAAARWQNLQSPDLHLVRGID